MKIWSFRYSVAHGYNWVIERECQESGALQWLEIFRKDEPNVLFLASIRKPPKR